MTGFIYLCTCVYKPQLSHGVFITLGNEQTQEKMVSQGRYSLRKHIKCRAEVPSALSGLSSIWRVARNSAEKQRGPSKLTQYSMGYISARHLPNKKLIATRRANNYNCNTSADLSHVPCSAPVAGTQLDLWPEQSVEDAVIIKWRQNFSWKSWLLM